jgi:hypothetical protein
VRVLTFIFFFFQTFIALAQRITPLDLQVDYVDGILVFKPSDACLKDTSCHSNISQLKEALSHIIVRKPDKKGINSFMPFKIGSTEFYLTIYHYPFSATATDTILRLENDTIIIHDVGADGLLTDSTREYCIDKRTHQRLDWNSTYYQLVESGVCPINCFMTELHSQGYKGYVLQLLKDGHTAIMYY